MKTLIKQLLNIGFIVSQNVNIQCPSKTKPNEITQVEEVHDVLVELLFKIKQKAQHTFNDLKEKYILSLLEFLVFQTIQID